MWSRRQLFTFFLPKSHPAEGSPTKEVVIPRLPGPVTRPSRMRMLPVHRPPGAVSEQQFLELCSRCGDCQKVCPHQAIECLEHRFPHLRGTPIIRPSEAPCHLCSERPCQKACATGALNGQSSQKMGQAHINPLECLAWQRSTCTTCHERCPVSETITLDELSRPSISSEKCLGCGICQFSCPAPRNAIAITANSHRSSK